MTNIDKLQDTGVAKLQEVGLVKINIILLIPWKCSHLGRWPTSDVSP
jgi:hypothetical protein